MIMKDQTTIAARSYHGQVGMEITWFRIFRCQDVYVKRYRWRLDHQSTFQVVVIK
jgi:hypothetical protein